MNRWLCWWTQFARRRGWVREPTGEERIIAHLQALRARADERVHLKLENQPVFCVALEKGLSRVELSYDKRSAVELIVYADALLVREHLSHDARRSSVAADEGQLDVAFDAKRAAFRCQLPASDLALVAKTAKRLLMTWLEQDPSDLFSVAIEAARDIDDSELVEHIKQLVNLRDLESRRRVYQAIVEASFLIPVELDGDSTHPRPISDGEALGGQNAWTVFSNRVDFERRRQSQPAMLISGVRLIQLASRPPLRALQINPGARYGGELYPHEVESIAEYLRRFGMLEAPDEGTQMVH